MTRKVRTVLAAAIATLVLGLALSVLLPEIGSRIAASLTGVVGGPFTLTATDGRTVTDRTYHGKWVLIYFGYTNCPDDCPTALNNVGVALNRLGADAAAVQPLFITVDPKRDTRERLAEYLESFDPRIVALTGTEDQIAAVAKEYRVYVSAHPGDGSVDHSSFFYLIDPDGKFRKVLGGDLSGEALAKRLRELTKPAAWG